MPVVGGESKKVTHTNPSYNAKNTSNELFLSLIMKFSTSDNAFRVL